MTSRRKHLAFRIWLSVSVALILAAGLLLAFILLQPQRANTLLGGPTQTPVPTATPSPPVATIDGYTITEEDLAQATALNQLLSELSDQPPVSQAQTLQSLINQRLVLQGAPPQETPTDAEVDDYIARMREAWDLSEEELAVRLASAGLKRSFLEETVRRLLSVQAAAAALDEEGEEISLWLSAQRNNANIEIFRQMSNVPATRAPGEEPSPSPDDRASASPTAQEMIRPPTPTLAPRPEVPEVAADFTLRQAGGGSFTLEEQLEEGAVVLVFFERCG